MKPDKRFLWPLLMVGLTLLLAGCSGSRLASTSWPGISIEDNLAYIAFNQNIYAIDAQAQRVQWQFPGAVDAKSPAYYAPPVITDGLMVIGGYDNVLYGIDRESLTVEWAFHRASDRYIGSPVLFDGMVFVATAGNELFALKLAELERLGTGAEKADEARRAAELAAIQWQFTTKHGNWSEPLVTPETIYISSLDHHVYALETATGREIWSAELPGAMAGTPLLSAEGDKLFVGNFDYSLYALDVKTGQQLWRVVAENWVWDRPELAGDKLFFGDLGGNLYAVDPDSGEVLWSQQVADAIRGRPVYDPETGRLYVTGRKVANPGNISTRGVVLALDPADYRIVWEQATDETIYTSPAVQGDLVLVTPAQGNVLLQVFNAETGVLQWQHIPPTDK